MTTVPRLHVAAPFPFRDDLESEATLPERLRAQKGAGYTANEMCVNLGILAPSMVIPQYTISGTYADNTIGPLQVLLYVKYVLDSTYEGARSKKPFETRTEQNRTIT